MRTLKLLYFTDLHMRGDQPRARLDNYQAAMSAKLAEIRSLVAEHDCQAVLFGGDLTHRPDIAESVVADLITELRRFTVPIIGVWGNTHDIWGDNPATIRRTALGIVQAAGLIDLLHPGQTKMLQGDGFKVQVTGQGFHVDMDRRPRHLDYCVAPGEPSEEGWVHRRYESARWAIHIVHGLLRERPLAPDVPVTLIDEIAPHTAADITLTGHDHVGFGVVRRNGRWFCNPGALMRLTAAREEIARPVQVAIITLTDDECKVELIPLQSAAPGTEVLDRSHIERAAEQEHALEQFLAGVRAGSDLEALDVTQIVQRIADNRGVPDRVRQEALERVQRSQEAVSRGAVVEEVA